MRTEMDDTGATGELGSAETPLLPEKTNEELLALLQQARQRRQRTRRVLKIAYWVGFVIYLLFIFWNFPSGNPAVVTYKLLAIACFCALNGSLLAANRFSYRRTAKKRDMVIAALAQRGDTRAVGPLLEIMDIRANGSMAWEKSGPVLIEAMVRLIDRLTPEDFQGLTDTQIHQLTPMLMLHNPVLSPRVEKILCRCGDARTLRALRRLQKWSKPNAGMQKWYPGMKLMLRQMRKRNMPSLDAESIESINICCMEIADRVEADQRNAQLLRASGTEAFAPASELLRGANADTAVASDYLLRPVSNDGELQPEATIIHTVSSHSMPAHHTEYADTQQVTRA